MADPLALQQPVGDGGIETVNFFNGRLLTAADMAREQDARRLADARLGEALGDGIVFGLEVTAATAPADAADAAPLPTVVIRPGLAVNRQGQVLRLVHEETVHLSRLDGGSFAASPACTFGEWTPASAGTYVAGQGLYILTIAPAAFTAGRAQTNGLGGAAAACNIDRRVEAVQFRLLAVPQHLVSMLDASSPGYRNAAAYRCFGDGALQGWLTGLFGQPARGNGLADDVAAHGLGSEQVPLALLAFRGSAELTFLDSWAVRRPASLADPAGGALPSLAAPRRPALGRAMFHQFQAQLEDLVGRSGTLGTVTVRSHFPLLPPVGILPHFTLDMVRTFFAGVELRGPQHVNSPQIEPLLRESMAAPALRAASPEVLWLYAVADNRIAIELAEPGTVPPDPYFVFASSNLAYRADARFNLHRWDYANLALSA